MGPQLSFKKADEQSLCGASAARAALCFSAPKGVVSNLLQPHSWNMSPGETEAKSKESPLQISWLSRTGILLMLLHTHQRFWTEKIMLLKIYMAGIS